MCGQLGIIHSAVPADFSVHAMIYIVIISKLNAY